MAEDREVQTTVSPRDERAYRFIQYAVESRIAYVTIDRPGVLGHLHAEANEEMADIFARFRDDDAAWVAILTGAGDRAFSAGNDLKATAARGAAAAFGPGRNIPLGGITRGFACDKPIIAAVNGWAMGGGFELALACDVIAADHARFALPEPRVGLVAAAGGMHRLPEHVGLKVAMGMMLTATPIDALEAHRVGIVNQVVPLAELMATARRWAGLMLECSPVSLRITKQCIHAGLGRPCEVAMAEDIESDRLAVLYRSADFVEGPRAFAEKRPPRWAGR